MSFFHDLAAQIETMFPNIETEVETGSEVKGSPHPWERTWLRRDKANLIVSGVKVNVAFRQNDDAFPAIYVWVNYYYLTKGTKNRSRALEDAARYIVNAVLPPLLQKEREEAATAAQNERKQKARQRLIDAGADKNRVSANIHGGDYNYHRDVEEIIVSLVHTVCVPTDLGTETALAWRDLMVSVADQVETFRAKYGLEE